MLTKVVGFFSFMILLPWLWAVWRGWPGVRWQRPMLMWLVSGLACAVVVAAWLIPIWLRARHDPAVAAYLHELVVTHTVGRFVNPWHHYRPAWYYAQVICTLWLPLAVLLPWLLPRWREALRQRDARVLLPLGFVVLYVAFFTLTRGKRDIYILSALPMLALVTAPFLPQLLARSGVQRALAGIAALVGLVCAGAVAWLGGIDPDRGGELLRSAGVASFAPLLVLGAAALVALALAGLHRAHAALAVTLASGWLIAGWWVFPQMDDLRSARSFIARLEQVADPGRELGLLAYHEHFLWHLTRPVTNFGHRRFREAEVEMDDAAAWLAARPGRQLLVQERALAPCFRSMPDRRSVGDSSRGLWFVVSGLPEPSCSVRGDPARAIEYRPLARLQREAISQDQQ